MEAQIGNIPSSEFDADDMIPVSISFYFHDLECIGDGEASEVFWISKDDYLKIEEYYSKPWAQFIGVMINLQMPELKRMVEERVSGYAMDVFISHVTCDEDVLSHCFEHDDNAGFDEYARSLVACAIDSDMAPEDLVALVRSTIDDLKEIFPHTDKYVYIDEQLLIDVVSGSFPGRPLRDDIVNEDLPF